MCVKNKDLGELLEFVKCLCKMQNFQQMKTEYSQREYSLLHFDGIGNVNGSMDK